MFPMESCTLNFRDHIDDHNALPVIRSTMYSIFVVHLTCVQTKILFTMNFLHSLCPFCDKSPHLMQTPSTPGGISHSFTVDTGSAESISSKTGLLSFHPVNHVRPTCKIFHGIKG